MNWLEHFLYGFITSGVLLLVWVLLSPILAVGGVIELYDDRGSARFDVVLGTVMWILIGLIIALALLGYVVKWVFGL